MHPYPGYPPFIENFWALNAYGSNVVKAMDFKFDACVLETFCTLSLQYF